MLHGPELHKIGDVLTRPTGTMPGPSVVLEDAEKASRDLHHQEPEARSPTDSDLDLGLHGRDSIPPSKLATYTRDFERTLIKYNIEARGVRRVLPHECQNLTKRSYLQPFFLWSSINLAAQNVTLGMLGPYIYLLSFRDASICAFFGSAIGAAGVSYIATFGPISGNRTLIFARYTFGWYPSKLLVILNLILLLGYSLIDLVIAGQILSAVSTNGSMSIVVGIIVVAIIGWLITTFGISVFHTYQRYAFIPQLIAYSILYGVSSHNYDLSSPSQGDSRTVIGRRISFLSLTLAAAITYGGAAADYFVYYPPSTAPVALFTISLVSLLCSFTFTYCIGIGLASGIASVPTYNTAYETSQGALIVAGFTDATSPRAFNTGFGKFLAVIVALGLIANLVPPTYSSGIDFQVLGKNFQKIPRVIWNSVGVVIYTVCALAGQGHLAEIFTNFLALMGYWVIIWMGITLEEQFFFRSRFGFKVGIGNKEGRRGWGQSYDWDLWDQPEKLPHGIAALIAFLAGWAGLGSCGIQSGPNDHIVALSREIMQNGANPNANPKCGSMIGIWNPHTKTKHEAKIVDTCVGCKTFDIDVSPALFKQIAPSGDGRVHGINWGGNKVGG
ncbi:MAG: hypothetical protein Q9223_000146 [Gallowayella weberi]